MKKITSRLIFFSLLLTVDVLSHAQSNEPSDEIVIQEITHGDYRFAIKIDYSTGLAYLIKGVNDHTKLIDQAIKNQIVGLSENVIVLTFVDDEIGIRRMYRLPKWKEVGDGYKIIQTFNNMIFARKTIDGKDIRFDLEGNKL